MALGVGPVGLSWTRQLRDVAIPHLELLSSRTGETANLAVRVGTKLHFLWSQEGNKTLRIVSRMGAVLPEEALRRLYQGKGAAAVGAGLTDADLSAITRELRAARRNGFTTTNQQTEKGVTAIAVALRSSAGRAIAAISLSIPSIRFTDLLTPDSIALIWSIQHDLENDILAAPL